MVKTAAYFAVVVLGAFAVFFGVTAYHFLPIDPHSANGIERLRVLAQTSQPAMEAIEDYHRVHGCYPARPPDLSPSYDKHHLSGWYYEGWIIRENAQQYSRSILPGPGHDPILRFSHHADGSSQWIYDPGDGSVETPLPFQSRSNHHR